MFQPIIPTSGLAGWRFLQRTYDSQMQTFTESAALKRDSTYFRETIGTVKTAEDLVSDRRLMRVALGAFGLQDDIDNRFFIRKILEEGTTERDALANRFADNRYQDLSKAFGFGPKEFLKVGQPDFAETIIKRFETKSFEVAAGEQDPAMRVALHGQREVELLATDSRSNNARWFHIMGDPPLRQLFETALNLPKAVGQLDLDQQLTIFKDRAQRVFGSEDLSVFTDEGKRQELVDRFLVRDQISNMQAGMSSNAIALTLLQSG